MLTTTVIILVNGHMLYNYGVILFILYWLFFVNYILSFSLGGLWTIQRLVQVQRHWVQFILTSRVYDNHNSHNKPQIGNEAGVWMTSCLEAMGWEFGDFEKCQLGVDFGSCKTLTFCLCHLELTVGQAVGRLTFCHVDRHWDCLPLR